MATRLKNIVIHEQKTLSKPYELLVEFVKDDGTEDGLFLETENTSLIGKIQFANNPVAFAVACYNKQQREKAIPGRKILQIRDLNTLKREKEDK